MEKVDALRLSELTIRRDDLSLSLRGTGLEAGRIATPSADTPPADTVPVAAAPAESTPPPEAEADGPTIDSPLAGTFYRSPGPGKPKLTEEGAEVDQGAPVCIVEAMKLFNQVLAPCKCRVVSFLMEHGQAVKKGQPLARIETL